VQSLCLNKQSCSVGANNGVFGDPCSGVPKSLVVAYTCGGGVVDNCPNDPNKTEPGQCGCGVPEGTCGAITIASIEDLDRASVFRFAAFSDSRGEVDENTGRALKWIKAANHKFAVAVGDLFDATSNDDKTLDMWKNDSFYHNNLYPTFGNHCSRIRINGSEGSQTNWGRPAFTLNSLNLRGRTDVQFRKPTSEPIMGYKSKDDHSIKAYDDQYIDYYVKQTIGKFTVHIVSIYKGDHTAFAPRSAKFLFDKVVELSETKTNYDIIVVSGHEERWLWRACREGFNGGQPPLTESQVKFIVSTADLILAASDHRFRRLCETDYYWKDIKNPALQVDTGQVYNTSAGDGYVEFHVFDNPPRFTAQYINAASSTRKLHVGEAASSINGDRDCEKSAGTRLLKPMMKIVDGPITQPVDWNKF
jgi:hypothetical protein